MTVLGSDASFRSGGPQPALPDDFANTAAQTMMAKSLLIAKDTINDPQAMLQMLSTKEQDKSGHYQPQAGKPVLPMMAFLRMDPLAEGPADESWTNRFDQLMEKLPEDAKARLKEEMKHAFEEKSPLYLGLQRLIAMTAKALVWAEQAGKPILPGTPEAERYQNYAELPYLALLGAGAMNEEMLQGLRDLLDELGHNFIEYDPLNDALNDLVEMLGNFSEIAGRAVSGRATAEDSERLNNLASSIEEKIKVLQGRDQGGVSTLFLPYLKATRLVARAFSIPLAIAPQLILSVGVSQIGAEGEQGIEMGGALGAIMDKGLIENLGGKGVLVGPLLKALLPALGTAVSLLRQYGLGPSPLKGEKELEANKLFDLQISAHLVLKTGLLETVADALAESVKVPEKQRMRFKALLLFGALAVMALIGGGEEEKQVKMVSTLEKYFVPLFQFLLKSEEESEAGAESDKNSVALKALLQEAGAALEQGNYEDLVRIGWAGMAKMAGSESVIEKGMEEFKRSALNMAASIEGGVADYRKHDPELAVAV